MAAAPAIGVEVNGIFGGNGDVSLPLESKKEKNNIEIHKKLER